MKADWIFTLSCGLITALLTAGCHDAPSIMTFPLPPQDQRDTYAPLYARAVRVGAVLNIALLAGDDLKTMLPRRRLTIEGPLPTNIPVNSSFPRQLYFSPDGQLFSHGDGIADVLAYYSRGVWTVQGNLLCLEEPTPARDWLCFHMARDATDNAILLLPQDPGIPPPVVPASVAK